MASRLAEDIAGLSVDITPSGGAYAWIEKYLRESGEVTAFLRTHRMNPSSVRVVRVESTHILCSAAGKDVDHESPSPFLVEMQFRVYPKPGLFILVDDRSVE